MLDMRYSQVSAAILLYCNKNQTYSQLTFALFPD
jgi:hypothetical protein